MARDAVAAPALSKLPLLAFLPPDVRDLVVGSFVPATFAFGGRSCARATPPTRSSCSSPGRARVLKRRATNGEEVPLTSSGPATPSARWGCSSTTTRTATVRASSDVEALRLDRAVFEALLSQLPGDPQYFDLQATHRRLAQLLPRLHRLREAPGRGAGTLLARARAGRGRAGRARDPPGRCRRARCTSSRRGGCASSSSEDGRPPVPRLTSARATSSASCRCFRATPRAATVEAVLRLPAAARSTRGDVRRGCSREHPEFRRADRGADRPVRLQGTSRGSRSTSPRRCCRPTSRAHEKVGPAPGRATPTTARPTDEPARGAVRDGRRPLRQEAGGASAASRYVRQIDEMDCGAAVPRHGLPPLRARREPARASASSCTPASTARACAASARAPTSSASPRARQGVAAQPRRRCRCPPSSTGRATTGSCSTTWTTTHVRDRRPGASAAADAARASSSEKWTRLRRALRLHRGVRRRRPRRGPSVAWLVAVLPAATPALLLQAVGARR